MFRTKSAKNFVIIFFLGIASGLPLALILSTLKVTLLEQGFDLKTIGFFSLISIPYTFKFLFAPIVDSIKIPIFTQIFGQRKSWIILMQLLLAIFIITLGQSVVNKNIIAISIFALLVAFVSSIQDIIIDGYRIELLETRDQGFGATSYIYGYRIGMLISGAGALILSDFIKWNAVFFIMGIFMLSAIIATIFAKETRQNFEMKKHNFAKWFQNSVITPFSDFKLYDKWYLILIFIILFKLADAFAGNLTLPFLIEVGFSKTEIASIVKTFGLFATLFGVFCGGIIVKNINLGKTLWIASIMQMVSNLAFCYIAKFGYDPISLYFIIFIENFSGGIGDAVFVAFLSGLCNRKYSATQYAALFSLASAARSFLSSPAGIFAQNYGWFNFFIISTLLAIPSLIILYFFPSMKNILKNR